MLRQKIGGKKFKGLLICFRRRGRLKDPFYDVVLIKKGQTKAGAYKEKLGFYNPRFTEAQFSLLGDRFSFWVKNGARVHRTVKRFLSKLNIFTF